MTESLPTGRRLDPATLRFAHEPLAFGPRHTIGKGIVRPMTPAQRRILEQRQQRLATRCTACRAAQVGLVVAIAVIAGLVSLGLYSGVI